MTLARMAASYRHSAELLRQRMNELKEAARTAAPVEKSQLEQRVRHKKTSLDPHGNLYYNNRAFSAQVNTNFYRRSHP